MNEEALSIDLPTTQDMRNLKAWLKRELEVSRQEKLDELAELIEQGDLDPKEVNGSGFFNNWNIILEDAKAKRLVVCKKADTLVGFLSWDEKGSPNVMEVHPLARGRGVGRTLVDYYLAEALKQGISIMEIECSPQDSLGFWQRMGFVRMKTLMGVYATRIGPDPSPHVVDKGLPDQLKATFVHNAEGGVREAVAEGYGRFDWTESSPVLLQERLVVPDRRHCGKDVTLEIAVNEKIVFSGRARSENGRGLGVVRAGPGSQLLVLKKVDISRLELNLKVASKTSKKPF